jgi:hypothetical protein
MNQRVYIERVYIKIFKIAPTPPRSQCSLVWSLALPNIVPKGFTATQTAVEALGTIKVELSQSKLMLRDVLELMNGLQKIPEVKFISRLPIQD